MQNFKNLFALTLVTVLLVSTSCTMEKRQYLSGYHIEWFKKKQSKNKQETEISKSDYSSSEQTTTEVAPEKEDVQLSASVENSFRPVVKQEKISFPVKIETKRITTNEECDVMTLKNGDEIKVKVFEIGTSEIKYKKCDNPDGPIISIRKSDVFTIKYPNGTKDVITEPTKTLETKNITNPKGEKSFLITILLWAFLGFLGIHRFYLGHIGMGILYLLTAGLCGIGWIIDLILLLTGSLKPKSGEFTDDI